MHKKENFIRERAKPVVSLSLDQDLVEKLDDHLFKNRFKSRSKLVNDILRNFFLDDQPKIGINVLVSNGEDWIKFQFENLDHAMPFVQMCSKNDLQVKIQ